MGLAFCDGRVRRVGVGETEQSPNLSTTPDPNKTRTAETELRPLDRGGTAVRVFARRPLRTPLQTRE